MERHGLEQNSPHPLYSIAKSTAARTSVERFSIRHQRRPRWMLLPFPSRGSIFLPGPTIYIVDLKDGTSRPYSKGSSRTVFPDSVEDAVWWRY